MRGLLLLTTLLVPAHLTVAWSTKYAVDCPERCDNAQCRSSILRCKRLVLDDCSCCPVCAAGPGETCYRTVSGMDGVKCGPGLRCQFYNEEDDFGDEFGICKEREVASGDGNTVREEIVRENPARSPVMKWLNPR
uniref:Endothelial cell-specific molecule 1 n=1 Tax=Jaculus jaculus TaxID=51337 RepID=A0A8C5JZA0_JACJA